MTYQFDANIAALYGVDEAIMIANLEYWIRHNVANDKHYHDGRYWTYNSIDAFTKLFPFWTARQIRRIIQSLIDKNVLMTGNYNSSARDRTMWYAFTDEFEQKRQMHLTKTSNGNDGTVKCNIDSIINKEISIQIENTDNKPADGGLFEDQADFKPIVVTAPKNGKRRKKENVYFEQTEYFGNPERFCRELAETGEFPANTDYMKYYYAAVDWSRQGNVYAQWVSAIRGWMRKDMQKGNLSLIKQNCLSPDAIEYLKDMAR